MKVRPGVGCDFPSHLRVALVDWYVVAKDRESGFRKALEELQVQHFEFEAVVHPGVHEVNASEWNDYLNSLRGSLRDRLPRQDEVVRCVGSGRRLVSRAVLGGAR